MKQLKLRFRVLAFVVIGLLALAGVYGVYSVSTYGSRWISSTRNTRYRSAKSSVIPGDIIDRRGVVVATTDENGERIYQSNILSRSSMVHLLGDDEGNIANGVDSFQANYLLGFETSLTERVTAFFNGETRRGDNVTITADSRLCTEIVNIFRNTSNLKGKCGAVVVMNYKTGEVLALVSLPVYDPQNITDQVRNSSQHPFWNRALQGTLPPGSTFKIVTLATALEDDVADEDTVFSSPGTMEIGNATVSNFNKANYGSLTLAQATELSSNTVFGQLGVEMGADKLVAGAESFGFNKEIDFPLYTPESLMPSAEDLQKSPWELAWAAAGEPVGDTTRPGRESPAGPQATVLEMAMVGTAIANDGVIMQPYLVDSVNNANGERSFSASPTKLMQAVSKTTAGRVRDVLLGVVQNGTGTAAAIPGIDVAGKTGTAEKENGNDSWFVGMAPAEDPRVVVAIVIEDGEEGVGTAKAQNVLKTALEVQGLL